MNEATRGAFFPSALWQRALRDSDIDPRLKTVGIWMSVYADHVSGEMFPTLSALRLLCVGLEDDTKPVSERTIQRRRRELVRLGWIRLVKKGDGRGVASVYALSFPAVNHDTEAEETTTETTTSPSRKTTTGVSYQVQHQVYKDQELRNGLAAKGGIEEENPHPFADSTSHEQKSRQISDSTSRVNPSHPFAAPPTTTSAVQPPTASTGTKHVSYALYHEWAALFRRAYGRDPVPSQDVLEGTDEWLLRAIHRLEVELAAA